MGAAEKVGLIGMIGEAATGLGQTGFGIAQTIRGRKREKELTKDIEQGIADMPMYQGYTYGTPDAIGEKRDFAEDILARARAARMMPGERLMRSQIGQARAGAVGQARGAAATSSDLLNYLGQSETNYLGQLQNLGVQSAMFRQQQIDKAEKGLQGVMSEQASYDMATQQLMGAEAQKEYQSQLQKWDTGMGFKASQLGDASRQKVSGQSQIFSGLGQTFGALSKIGGKGE